MPAALRVIYADEGHCLGRLGAVQVQYWCAPIALDAARRARESAAQLPKNANRGLLIVVEPGVPPPAAEARKILTEVGTALEGAVGCAFISEGEGFVAAALRGVMTSMVLFVRPHFPVRVFSSVHPGAAWLAPLVSPIDSTDLVRAVDVARRVCRVGRTG